MRNEGFLKYDLHTHTSLCGGRDTHEQMVREAIKRGMHSIGFSEHSRISVLPNRGMRQEDEDFYRKEIERLRIVYGDQIRIFRGIEQDYYSDLPPLGYDYVIGSVHYLRVDGILCPVTGTAEEIRAIVKKHFGGDVFAFLRLYYQTVADLPRKTACDVIGHFDLIANINAQEPFFRESDRFYLGYVFKALDALIEQDVIFEVNTKALVDPCRRMPNPSLSVLQYLSAASAKIMLSSDAASSDELMRGFIQAAHLCKTLGFGSAAIYTENGWGRVCR